MPDAFKILTEITLHFNSHPVLEQVFSLRQQLRRQLAEALVCVLAIGCAAKIHPRIYHFVAAFPALAG